MERELARDTALVSEHRFLLQLRRSLRRQAHTPPGDFGLDRLLEAIDAYERRGAIVRIKSSLTRLLRRIGPAR